jgi:hypothetical protein
VAAGASADELAARALFRTERQTFIPLPDSARRSSRSTSTCSRSRRAITEPRGAQRLHDRDRQHEPGRAGSTAASTDARDRLLAWLAQRAHA